MLKFNVPRRPIVAPPPSRHHPIPSHPIPSHHVISHQYTFVIFAPRHMQPWSFPLYCFFQSLLIDCVHYLRANPKRSFSSTSSRDHPQRRFSPPFLLVRPSFPSWVGVPVEASSNTRGRDPQPRRPRRHAILTSYFLSSGGSFPPSTNRVNMSYPLVTGYTILVDRGCPRKTIKRSVVFDLKAGPSSSLLLFSQTLQTPSAKSSHSSHSKTSSLRKKVCLH